MSSDQKPDTLGVRAGGIRSDFQEHSEGLVLTTSFVYKSAAEAARRFANEEPGNIYSRFTNPTVTMFQSRLAALEGAEACVATATGMAAVATMALGLLKAGDHLIAARGVFGTVVPLFDQILKKLSIETTWVDLGDLNAWRKAVRPSTRLLFVETPSNPVCEVADIAALAQIAKKAGAILAVDNAMVSPALQRPIEFGADIVIHSATKYLEGQGRVLAGAICGRADLVNGPLYSFVRTAGPADSRTPREPGPTSGAGPGRRGRQGPGTDPKPGNYENRGPSPTARLPDGPARILQRRLHHQSVDARKPAAHRQRGGEAAVARDLRRDLRPRGGAPRAAAALVARHGLHRERGARARAHVHRLALPLSRAPARGAVLRGLV